MFCKKNDQDVWSLWNPLKFSLSLWYCWESVYIAWNLENRLKCRKSLRWYELLEQFIPNILNFMFAEDQMEQKMPTSIQDSLYIQMSIYLLMKFRFNNNSLYFWFWNSCKFRNKRSFFQILVLITLSLKEINSDITLLTSDCLLFSERSEN